MRFPVSPSHLLPLILLQEFSDPCLPPGLLWVPTIPEPLTQKKGLCLWCLLSLRCCSHEKCHPEVAETPKKRVQGHT